MQSPTSGTGPTKPWRQKIPASGTNKKSRWILSLEQFNNNEISHTWLSETIAAAAAGVEWRGKEIIRCATGRPATASNRWETFGRAARIGFHWQENQTFICLCGTASESAKTFGQMGHVRESLCCVLMWWERCWHIHLHLVLITWILPPPPPGAAWEGLRAGKNVPSLTTRALSKGNFWPKLHFTPLLKTLKAIRCKDMKQPDLVAWC